MFLQLFCAYSEFTFTPLFCFRTLFMTFMHILPTIFVLIRSLRLLQYFELAAEF